MIGEFVVPGPPVGKGRPRFNRASGRAYTPAKTEAGEARVREAWRAAGQPGPFLNPIGFHVTVVVSRPKSHFRVDGSLGKPGEREPLPMRLPDLDNVLKLVADSLNGCLFRDDRQIVHASVTRRWATVGEMDHLRVRFWDAQASDGEFAAVAA